MRIFAAAQTSVSAGHSSHFLSAWGVETMAVVGPTYAARAENAPRISAKHAIMGRVMKPMFGTKANNKPRFSADAITYGSGHVSPEYDSPARVCYINFGIGRPEI